MILQPFTRSVLLNVRLTIALMRETSALRVGQMRISVSSSPSPMWIDSLLMIFSFRRGPFHRDLDSPCISRIL